MSTATIDPRARVLQRRERIHALRMRVAAGAVIVFLTIWVVLFVQLATGHDPGLNDGTTTSVVQSSDPEAAAAGSDDVGGFDDGSGWSDGSAAAAGGDTGAGAVDSGAVTTRQS